MNETKTKLFTTKNILLVLLTVSIIVTIGIIEHQKTAPQNIQKEILAPSENNARTILKESKYPKAIELVSPNAYHNTNNLSITIKENIGKKVIIVDFWTYSCINCQRTIPYLNEWYKKYEDAGLLIIGVQSPEFDFEKDPQNVEHAIQKFGIKYPVIQDDNMQTWTAYNNHYWPHKYLIDIDGFIVYDHIGEGGYIETEQVIQQLLQERQQVLPSSRNTTSNSSYNPSNANSKTIATDLVSGIPLPDFSGIGTPEIYFGYAFARGQLGNEEDWQPEKIVTYKSTENQKQTNNKFYLEGPWLNHNDHMEYVGNESQGKISLNYHAHSVNLVAGAETPTTITISLDHKEYKTIIIKNFELYNLINETESDDHLVEITTPAGLMAYTFTFG